MDHKLDWTENGNGNMGSITPTCACGWTGSPEHNYNDDQITRARRQWQHHMRQVSQLGVGQPAPIDAIEENVEKCSSYPTSMTT